MIFYPENKTCNYEVEYTPDCVDAEQKRVNDSFGGLLGESGGEW